MLSIPAIFLCWFQTILLFLPFTIFSRLGHMGLSLLFLGEFLTLILISSLFGLYQGQMLATCL